jgi:hypothetical protein
MMGEDDFLKIEYVALRAEIIATQQRNFQTIGFGVLGLPALNYVLHNQDIQVISLALPVVVVVIVFLYLADNQGVLRCGRYIRLCIEPRVAGTLGWENWLERYEPPVNRTTECYMAAAVSILFFLYYVAATWIAWNYSVATMPFASASTVYCAYAATGAIAGVHVSRHLSISSRRGNEGLSTRNAEIVHAGDVSSGGSAVVTGEVALLSLDRLPLKSAPDNEPGA